MHVADDVGVDVAGVLSELSSTDADAGVVDHLRLNADDADTNVVGAADDAYPVVDADVFANVEVVALHCNCVHCSSDALASVVAVAVAGNSIHSLF